MKKSIKWFTCLEQKILQDLDDSARLAIEEKQNAMNNLTEELNLQKTIEDAINDEDILELQKKLSKAKNGNMNP
jgi:hypothetical protein